MTNTSVTTIAEKIFENLCTAIVKGEMPAGSKISEPELSMQLKVSRASLRDAIGRLEACRLVTRKANIGARVVSLSKHQLIEIYQVREALEGMAARLAAQNCTDQEIRKLRQLVEHHTREANTIDGASYFQQTGDLDFHFHIVQSSHNEHLINLLCHDLYHLMQMYRYQYGRASHRSVAATEEHRYVMNAIAEGDGEMAELLMRNHIRKSRQNIEQLLEAQS